MYCEKCNRIFEADRCPVCKSRKIREPEANDPCYLTEQDYISSGILEDILKQNSIPYLKKDIMSRKAIDLMYEAAEITEVDEKPAEEAKDEE